MNRNGLLYTKHDSPTNENPSEERASASNPGVDFLGPEEWLLVAQDLGLSNREMTVGVLLLEGQSRDAIAEKLGVARDTLRTFIDRLYKKSNVRSRLQFALRIARIQREWNGKKS